MATIHVGEGDAPNLILATCMLHNFLRDEDGHPPSSFAYCAPDGTLHDNGPGQVSLPQIGAFRVRERYTQYFKSDVGTLPWQDEAVYRSTI
jgi:hypothetical protein